jgi:SAM-dependent methyltransferase
MRANIQKLVARLDGAFPLPEPIYEFGAREVPGQELRVIRPLFAGREYLGCDIEPGPGVDCVLDLERLALPDASIGTVIALDTLEHVERFWAVGPELHRVLRPGGVAVLTSVMYFPIHEYPADYWRFTPDGMRAFARPFETSLIGAAGLADFPHSVVAIGIKAGGDPATAGRLERALRHWSRHEAQGAKEWLTLLLPPILLAPAYRHFTRFTAWRRRRAGT